MWKKLMRHFRGKPKDRLFQKGDPVMTRQPHLHVEEDRMDIAARNPDQEKHEHHPPDGHRNRH
jgi:hypothetical protein